MLRHRCWPRHALALALVALTALGAARAAAAPVRIRGGAKLEARARHLERGELELRGRLTDDDGAVIPDEMVSADVEGASGWSQPEPCRSPRLSVSRARTGTQTLVRGNTRGEICIRWSNAPDQGRLLLRFSGDDYHAAAELTVGFDRTSPPRRPTTLRFDPKPTLIDVDRELVVVGAVVTLGELSPGASDGAAPGSVAGLLITIEDAAGDVLGRAETSGAGKVRFPIDGARLGEPGAARLRVGFAGTPELEPASDEQAVTLRATVALRLDGAVPPWRPGEPIAFDVLASAGRGTVDSGVVEARLAGQPLATVPVRAGRARAVLSFEPATAAPASITLRYLPASPSWVAGRDLEVLLEPASSVRWAPWIWGAVVTAAGLWTGLSWRRARRSADMPRPAEREKPGIRLVGKPARKLVWSGVVIDAHEGAAVAHAMLTVLAGARGVGSAAPPVLQCTADGTGRFRFDFGGRPVAHDLVLLASAPRHSAEQSPLPPPGELRVVLTTRRRALLRRLVEWARVRGAPFAREPEPTPADVARAAGDDRQVSDWAVAVERAAFDVVEVDEEVEQRVRGLEPARPIAADGPRAPAPPTELAPSAPANPPAPAPTALPLFSGSPRGRAAERPAGNNPGGPTERDG